MVKYSTDVPLISCVVECCIDVVISRGDMVCKCGGEKKMVNTWQFYIVWGIDTHL